MADIIQLDGAAQRRASLESLMHLVGDDLNKVNHTILDRMESRAPLIPQLAGHIIASGGKRLRPMLTLACTRLCGYVGERQIGLAAAVEFIHTASLLHDDVVDESDMRRGEATANLLWGNQPSVLVGDFLFSRAFQIMVADGSLEVLRVLANASAIIAEGEVMQLETLNNVELAEEKYLQVVTAKTSALFSAACSIGALIAGKGRAEEEALDSFGRNLGMAFQLVDDTLDYSAQQATLGKTIGDDFRECKVTMPVLLAFRRGDRDDARDIFRSVLERVPDVDLANQTLYNLAEVYRIEERYIDQLNLLRTVGRLGQTSKRRHRPGDPLSIVVHDSDLGISRGHSRIPVIVSTEPGGDRELVYLTSSGAGKGLFRVDLNTQLGDAQQDDRVLQLTGIDIIRCDYPDEFKADFKNVPLSDVEIRMAANADFKVASSQIQTDEEQTFSQQLQQESGDTPTDSRVSSSAETDNSVHLMRTGKLRTLDSVARSPSRARSPSERASPFICLRKRSMTLARSSRSTPSAACASIEVAAWFTEQPTAWAPTPTTRPPSTDICTSDSSPQNALTVWAVASASTSLAWLRGLRQCSRTFSP